MGTVRSFQLLFTISAETFMDSEPMSDLIGAGIEEYSKQPGIQGSLKNKMSESSLILN